jgi:hypothetical protein
MATSSSSSFECWKSDWSIGFAPQALRSASTMQCLTIDRTFVRVEIMSIEMLKAWVDLMKQNHPRLVTASRINVLAAGPCKLYICYLTTNHADYRDPLAVSCVLPMYVNARFICYHGLMELGKTLVGTLKNNEPLILMNMSAKMAPRNDAFPYQYIFISPTQAIGKSLREFLDSKNVNYSRCVAGTLYSAFVTHPKNKCKCSLEVGNWRDVKLIQEFEDEEKPATNLPRISFAGEELGYINVPWATGYCFNIIKQNGWTIEDESIAALTSNWYQRSGFLSSNAEKASFLSILVGTDGIHIIDFADFTSTDPLEPQHSVAPIGQGSVSETSPPLPHAVP